MSFTAQERRNNLWFGTEESFRWVPTPNRGADVSPQAWGDGGTLLNGGGYQLNSFGSHKNYIFEWPASSAREMAQLMKSYADGSYGRGLIYFQDPLTYTTNVLPAKWADPSMGVGYEGASLVYGLDPESVPTSNWQANDLPVRSAYYDLGAIAAGWRGKEDAVFIPIPTGYSLALGSFHAQTGNGRVFYREQSTNGALGATSILTGLAADSDVVVNTLVSGADLAGVWLYIGKTASGAGTVTLSGMVGRLIRTSSTVSTPVATNLFTNPRLVGDGTYAEVARNLFTNPRLKGDGTWAEVRRNYVTKPYPVGNDTSGWTPVRSTLGSDTSTVSPSGRRFVLSVTEVGALPSVATMTRTLPAGDHEVVISRDMAGVVPIFSGVFSGSTQLGGTGAAGTTDAVIRYPFSLAASTSVQIRIGAPQGSAVSTAVAFTAVLMGKGPFFNPDAPFGSIDPDMRQRWLGAENASESVMEIEQVRGVEGTNAIAGVSARDGKPAIRVIPTSAVNPDSRARILMPAGVRNIMGTALGTLHLDAPIPAPVHSRRGTIMVDSPIQNSEQSPNVAGAYEKRLVFDPVVSSFGLSLPHGGLKGSGDVWWTDIGLFAGDYDGPVFNGSSLPHEVDVEQPEDFRWRWAGDVDNSESVMEIERVAGTDPQGCIAGVSSRNGKPAMRLIPTSATNNNSYVTLSPIEAAGTIRTLVGTVHLDAPLTGTLGPYPALLRFSGQASPPGIPNLPGTYPQRLTYTYAGVGTFATVRHGGAQGSGDVWWTDIGLFAGDYDGPAFSGADSDVIISGRNLRTQWDGAEDNSTSTAYTRVPEYDALQRGPWVGGQGHSGCRFIGKPTYVNNTGVGGGQVSFAASFREVGSWIGG